MKAATQTRCSLFCALLAATGAGGASAQSAAQLDLLVSLIPPDLRGGVRVVVPTAAGLEVVREGSNRFTCVADTPGDDRFVVSCYHESLGPFLDRMRALRASGLAGSAARERTCAEVSSGRLPMPKRAYNLSASGPLVPDSDVPDSLLVYHLLQIPFATEASEGITDEEHVAGQPWLHHAGTCDAHIMWSETKTPTVRSARVQEPSRTVHGTTITSDSLPAARLVFDSTLSYVGTQAIMLSQTTQAEQHFFLELHGNRIKRLYWVQFEGKGSGLGRPYDYSSDPTIEVNGRDFHVNYRYYPPSGFAGRAGSDGDRAHQFLRDQGYELGADLMRVRLVWLLDDPPLNELMIIYVEDLEERGVTVAELRGDSNRWEHLQGDLLRHALAGMRIEPLPPMR